MTEPVFVCVTPPSAGAGTVTVHVNDAPGARVAAVQSAGRSVTTSSATVTSVRVTLPVEVLIAPVRVRPPVVSLRLKAPLLALFR